MVKPAPVLLAAVLLAVSCTANAPHRLDAQGRALRCPSKKASSRSRSRHARHRRNGLERLLVRVASGTMTPNSSHLIRGVRLREHGPALTVAAVGL